MGLSMFSGATAAGADDLKDSPTAYSFLARLSLCLAPTLGQRGVISAEAPGGTCIVFPPRLLVVWDDLMRDCYGI